MPIVLQQAAAEGTEGLSIHVVINALGSVEENSKELLTSRRGDKYGFLLGVVTISLILLYNSIEQLL